MKNRNWPRLIPALAATLLGLASCTPNETQTLLEPSRAIGIVAAEEAARLAGARKQVALILPDASWGPASSVEEALRAGLKKQGCSIVVAKSADLGDPMRRGQVGLKSADFFEALDKAVGAGAVVSLAGAPLLRQDEATRLRPDHPPVLVVATASLGNLIGVTGDPSRLTGLLEARIIQLAIVDGAAESATPPSGKADATHQLFSQHYHILRGAE
ncbi:MAG: hypothetical protein C5B50_10925 [Verrucomicrobia bacterium]|nr:MAG: hypothetical protein C5B50_10925 [Verrucomicrobiota bacterium]